LSYLLDTNVISEIQKGSNCHEAVREWWSAIDISEVYLSVLVPGEIQRGIEKLLSKDSSRARRCESWLNAIIQGFEGRILSFDLETARVWGTMTSKRTLPLVDGLLAATAVAHNLTLVTRNTKGIQGIGVNYLNPFDA
jgi:predicted nucleic acid-binding protein